MTKPRHRTLLIAAIAGCVLLPSWQAQAQWWSHQPADFEECADAAEKAATKQAKTAALTECNAKFAGRRKPGGGYTYFDFMQNRSFDIAGPNPTPQEQKQIDEHYTAFLDRERRSRVAAALSARQQQLQNPPAPPQPQQVALVNEKMPLPVIEKVPLPVEAPNKPSAARSEESLRAKTTDCANHSFSCEWPRLSEKINDLRKLFVTPSTKPGRS